jgi:hypothetical protein
MVGDPACVHVFVYTHTDAIGHQHDGRSSGGRCAGKSMKVSRRKSSTSASSCFCSIGIAASLRGIPCAHHASSLLSCSAFCPIAPALLAVVRTQQPHDTTPCPCRADWRGSHRSIQKVHPLDIPFPISRHLQFLPILIFGRRLSLQLALRTSGN